MEKIATSFCSFEGLIRKYTLVGINFRSAKRNIDEPLFAKM